jgi:hypothetical protein
MNPRHLVDPFALELIAFLWPKPIVRINDVSILIVAMKKDLGGAESIIDQLQSIPPQTFPDVSEPFALCYNDLSAEPSR